MPLAVMVTATVGTISAVVAVMIVVGDDHDVLGAGMTRCTILWIVVIHDRLRVKIKMRMVMLQRLG